MNSLIRSRISTWYFRELCVIVHDGGNMKICLGHGDMEIWRHGVSSMERVWDMEIRRYGYMEIWSKKYEKGNEQNMDC